MFVSCTRPCLLVILLACLTLLPATQVTHAGNRFITVASTTSTDNSGLLAHILPSFEKAAGIQVRTIIAGTGRAINLAERGDVDALFVHHPLSEEQFVRQGYGLRRYDVMYNDFVIVGPAADPAGIRGMDNAVEALRKIATARASFTSRGDDSGTHKQELSLWSDSGIDPQQYSGQWYRETGSGQGATLNLANAIDAYALTDYGTWMSFTNKDNLRLMLRGNPPLLNQYGVILVNPARHPHVKAQDTQCFIDWLISGKGQRAIAGFTHNGQQLFFPNAAQSTQAPPACIANPDSD